MLARSSPTSSSGMVSLFFSTNPLHWYSTWQGTTPAPPLGASQPGLGQGTRKGPLQEPGLAVATLLMAPPPQDLLFSLIPALGAAAQHGEGKGCRRCSQQLPRVRLDAAKPPPLQLSYLASEVADNEGIHGPLGLLEVGAAEVGLVELLCPAPITALGHLKGRGVGRVAEGSGQPQQPAPVPCAHLALLVQQVQDAKAALDELNAWLVVTEVNVDPRDLLGHVLLLLQFEDMLEGEMGSRMRWGRSGCSLACLQAAAGFLQGRGTPGAVPSSSSLTEHQPHPQGRKPEAPAQQGAGGDFWVTRTRLKSCCSFSLA